MKQETINELLALAETSFNEKAPPAKYAGMAAHHAAVAAATQYDPDYANTAALIAATTLVCATTEAATFSARITEISNDKAQLDRHYEIAQRSYGAKSEQMAIAMADKENERLSPVIKNIYTTACESRIKITLQHETMSYGNDANKLEKAKRAALYVYGDTYAATRSAYVRAMFAANFNKKDDVKSFKAMMSAKLNKDLKYDNIPPGFFLKLIASTSLCIIAGLMLIAGIVAITLASCGVAAATLPFVPTISIGSTGAGLGTGLLIGSIFARRQKKNLEEANQNRMDMGLPV